ncbi:hypothetical protein BKA70DRAFT_1442877 [Coprinopsis sp. MPI-PUGE-AT-0042]|nr:hypothetical protein BKA70DRAFT_1442877 [Coprinopsis sp. MPI-PUGE-AT-0042]
MNTPQQPAIVVLPPVGVPMGSTFPNQGTAMAPGDGMPVYPPQGSMYAPQQGSMYAPQQGSTYAPQQGSVYPPQQGSIYSPLQPAMMPPPMAPTGQSMPYYSSPSQPPAVPLQAQQFMPPGGPGPMPLPATGMPMAPSMAMSQPMMAGAAPNFAQPAYSAYPNSAPAYQNPGPMPMIAESVGHRREHYHRHNQDYPGADNGAGPSAKFPATSLICISIDRDRDSEEY